MASKKRLERRISEMDFLTEQEVMTYVDVNQTIFEKEWMPYLNRYDNGKKKELMYDKAQVAAFFRFRKAIEGRPFEEWARDKFNQQL